MRFNIRKRILTCLEDFVIKRGEKEIYHGIILCDINLDKSDNQEFFRISREALDLIAKTDPRRFERVREELKYIINRELVSTGQYRRRLHACIIDFWKYKFDKNYKWYLYQYAGTIIHEATHGYLMTKKIKYIPKDRVQIERICNAEGNRFFKKLDYELKDQLINKFDENDWDFSWHASRWERTKALWRRIRESLKKTEN